MVSAITILTWCWASPVAAAEATATWPVDEAGVLFCYRSPHDVVAFDADGARKQSYGVVPSDLRAYGFTYSDAGGGLVLVRGRYQAKDVSDFLVRRLAAATAVTLEATFTPAGAATAAGLIVALGGPDGNDLALVQGPDGLAVEVRGGTPVHLVLAPAASVSMHAVVTVSDGQLHAWVDGVARPPQPAVLARQPAASIIIGSEQDGARPWSGTLHTLALYDRSVDAAAHQAAMLRRLGARPVIPRTTLEVEVVEVSATPTPNGIAPYYRGLVVCSYRVLRVIDGPAPDAAIIKIAHWGVMGNRQLAVKDLKVGNRQHLAIEAMAAHPYLSPEHLSEDLNDNLDAPLFYEVSGWSLRAALTMPTKVLP